LHDTAVLVKAKDGSSLITVWYANTAPVRLARIFQQKLQYIGTVCFKKICISTLRWYGTVRRSTGAV